MKKIIALTLATVLALALAACGGKGGAKIPEIDETVSISVDISAENAYVLNADSGAVLYQKNSGEHIAPASTAKMLTALTVLDYCSLEETFTVGMEIHLIASDSSVSGLAQGEIMTVRQLLYALLLPSGNDAAYTLAVNTGIRIAGGKDISPQRAIDAFVDAMNRKAALVGAESSHFEVPDGYDAKGQYTTAFDLALIAKACLYSDILSEIMASYRINDTLVSGRRVDYLNTNELLNPDSRFYYSNVVGLKTGSTAKAGNCLVSAAKIGGATYICVVMGDSETGRYSDTLAVYKEIDPAVSMPSLGFPSDEPGELPGRLR